MRLSVSFRIFLLLLISGVTMSSCTVYYPMMLEVLHPGETRLPEETQKIGWLYRHFRYPGDSLQNYFRDGDYLVWDQANEAENLDSIMASLALQSAADGFRQNGIDVESVFFPIEMMPFVSEEKLTPLPASLVQKLARPSGADQLAVLETFSWFYSRFEGGIGYSDEGEVAVAGIWALYDGKTGQITETRSMVDTLYWSGETGSAGSVSMGLPPRLPALEIAAVSFGESYARRFYPEWMTVDRLLVIPPTEEFREAAENALNQEWEKSIDIWRRYSDDRFGKLAVTARYNLALASETNDQIMEAIQWIEQAETLAGRYHNKKEIDFVNRYRMILENRRREILRMESWGE